MWGKPFVPTGSMAQTLGKINPFRYRGYVYDQEEQLYYLRTRYYQGEFGRFLNGDATAYIAVTDDIGSDNLFQYSRVNPIAGYDPDGTFDFWGILKGVGRAIAGAASVVLGATAIVAGAPIATIIIAGFTIVGGVLTMVNGAADVQESIPGDNFVRDSVFDGDASKYEGYALIVQGLTSLGAGYCGVYLAQSCTAKGYVSGTNEKVQMQPGQQVIRYGQSYGRYMTDPGTSIEKVAVTPGNSGILQRYMVTRPFVVDKAIVAAHPKWGPGGGVQYFSWRSVQRLVQMGYISPR